MGLVIVSCSSCCLKVFLFSNVIWIAKDWWQHIINCSLKKKVLENLRLVSNKLPVSLNCCKGTPLGVQFQDSLPVAGGVFCSLEA